MKSLKNYGIAAIGVVLLTVAVSWSGFGQALASEARAAVQKVSITNKSIAVSGIAERTEPRHSRSC
jgi:hypothetical protein